MTAQTNHPTERNLALFAGGDLPWYRRWLVGRHVRDCGACQQVSSEFAQVRGLGEITPDLNWTRLAQEMKANIRLGLEAGECVGRRPAFAALQGRANWAGVRTTVSGKRLLLAGGLLSGLVAVGTWVGRPDLLLKPNVAPWQRAVSGTVLQGWERGLEVRGTRQTLRIRNPAAMNVVYSVGAQGELRARSLDPETGNVAITHVYGE